MQESRSWVPHGCECGLECDTMHHAWQQIEFVASTIGVGVHFNTLVPFEERVCELHGLRETVGADVAWL